MWVLECNNNHGQNPTRTRIHDPNPFPPPCFYTHNTNLPTWNKTLTPGDYVGKREMTSNNMAPLVSSRWNPTSEQVQALEEMYRQGIKTPSAQQIQQITAKLKKFGRIEGKNVFYWFQNHKARERQKKRRLQAAKDKMRGFEMIGPENNQSGYLETKHPKRLLTPSSCTTTSECTASMQAEEGRQGKCTNINCKELQQLQKGPHTFCKLDLLLSPNNYIKAPAQENEILSYGFEYVESRIITKGNDRKTLQLFPVGRGYDSSIVKAEIDESDCEEENCGSSLGTKLAPIRFFEFFPINY